MPDLLDEIDAAIDEANSARKVRSKSSAVQISGIDELGLLKSVSLAWLRTHRPAIIKWTDDSDVAQISALYQAILIATDKRPSRKPLVKQLKECATRLVALRSRLALVDTSAQSNDDAPPRFETIASDAAMQAILQRRWEETLRCIKGEAFLAATVMMGGLLEAMLMARVEKVTDKRPVFTATKAPKDKTGKTLPQKEWTLRDYIDVAHELKWITQSAKDVGEVLRDYRNYVHPYKEYSHKVTLVRSDADIFWSVTKSITKQIIDDS